MSDRWSIKKFWIITALLLTLCNPVFALDNPDYNAAVTAKEKGEYQKALDLLERGYVTTNDALFLYERALVLEKMGQYDLALQVLDENAAALSAHKEISDLAIVKERIQQNQARANQPEPAGDWITPVVTITSGVLLIAGVSMVAVSLSQNGNTKDAFPDIMDGDPNTGEFRANYEDDISNQESLNTIGYVLAGVGVAGLSYGLFRLLTKQDNVGVAVSPAGISGNVNVQF